MTTAAEIFQGEGKLAFFQMLSSAAAKLRTRDLNPGDGVNTVEVVKNNVNGPTAPFQDDAFAKVAATLTLLSAADMPSLKPVKSGNANYPATGLEGGIFTNKNGAALLARSDDALFVSFRGTNDIDGDFDIGFTPDSRQWGDKRPDHYALFAKLDAAIQAYLKLHPEITKVYVTGHSLGGGMVNAFMQEHRSSLYEAVSFGSIRYGSGISGADARVTNVWNDADIALGLGGRADGASIRFKVVGPDPVSQHMPWLYQAEIASVSKLGYDIADLTAYNRIVLAASPAGPFASSIGNGADSLQGTSGRDLILGGANNDRLQGLAGRDRLDGGSGTRDLALYTEKTTAVAVTLGGSAWATVKVGGVAEDVIRLVEDVAGGSGNDTLSGDGASNRLTGNAGADVLNGGAGNDTLTGGLGRDVLIGGVGSDAFLFNVAPGTAHADRIADFAPGTDRILLEGDVFKALGASVTSGELYAAAGATKARDTNDFLIYNKTTGQLFYDADASKTAKAPLLVATFDNKPALAYDDFLIV